MNTKAKEFSVALARVAPLLKTRTTMPILNCVLLHASGGHLSITATDLDAYAMAVCDCEGDLPSVCVNAESLKYLVSQAEETISLDPGTRLKVTGNGVAHLATTAPEEFPSWPEQDSRALGVSIPDLADCIKAVAWATEPNPKVSYMIWRECVWVKITAKAIECCGCDGKEFAYVNRPIIGAAAEFMFPAKQAALLVSALNTGAMEVRLSQKFISTTSDTFEVAIRLAEEKYMPVEFLLNQQNSPVGIIGALDLNPVLDALHAIKKLGMEEPLLTARMEFDPEETRISWVSPRANFLKTIPRKQEGKPVTIAFDVQKGINVFSHVQPGGKVLLGDGSLLFACGDYTYALGLIKV